LQRAPRAGVELSVSDDRTRAAPELQPHRHGAPSPSP
jgi:hypothetical protein